MVYLASRRFRLATETLRRNRHSSSVFLTRYAETGEGDGFLIQAHTPVGDSIVLPRLCILSIVTCRFTAAPQADRLDPGLISDHPPDRPACQIGCFKMNPAIASRNASLIGGVAEGCPVQDNRLCGRMARFDLRGPRGKCYRIPES